MTTPQTMERIETPAQLREPFGEPLDVIDFGNGYSFVLYHHLGDFTLHKDGKPIRLTSKFNGNPWAACISASDGNVLREFAAAMRPIEASPLPQKSAVVKQTLANLAEFGAVFVENKAMENWDTELLQYITALEAAKLPEASPLPGDEPWNDPVTMRATHKIFSLLESGIHPSVTTDKYVLEPEHFGEVRDLIYSIREQATAPLREAAKEVLEGWELMKNPPNPQSMAWFIQTEEAVKKLATLVAHPTKAESLEVDNG